MKLGELLDELRNNILRDKSSLVAGDDDRMWTDESLLRYIGDAERNFARRTLCIRDATTPECTRVVLREGVSTYPLHNSVISVLSGRYDTDAFDLQRVGDAIVGQATPPEMFTYDPSTGWNLNAGRPIAIYTDETLVYARANKVTLTVFPEPGVNEAGNIIHLRVLRVPKTVYTADNVCEESEIPVDFQLDCLEWAAYRALRHFDADAGASTPSEHHKEAFDVAVAKAIKELKRTLFSNMPIRYGSNGFSYVR